jgi:gliding motility-associated lipoprotein GldD
MNMMRIGLVLMLIMLSFSCNSDFTQKPREYYRIDFPERQYQPFDQAGYPYSFEYPVYGKIGKDSSLFDENPDNPYWINIDFPEFNGRIYLSYKTIGGNSIYKVKTEKGYKDSLVKNTFEGLREEAFKMTYKHSLKASSIDDSSFVTPNGISGVYFKVGGNAATANQFFLTDSSRHFIRGALYFDAAPNADSLAPVNRFLQEDLKHMINTFKWR